MLWFSSKSEMKVYHCLIVAVLMLGVFLKDIRMEAIVINFLGIKGAVNVFFKKSDHFLLIYACLLDTYVFLLSLC